jgi:hypothetical protein
MEIGERFFRPPQGGYFLSGPRGTGELVWTQRRHPDALRPDLLDPEVSRFYGQLAARVGEPAGYPLTFRQSVALGDYQGFPLTVADGDSPAEERQGISSILALGPVS